MLKSEKDYRMSPKRQLKADPTKDHYAIIATGRKFPQRTVEAMKENRIIFKHYQSISVCRDPIHWSKISKMN